jgi:integrase
MPRARGSGSVYQQKNSSAYWIKYYRNGVPVRETTRSTDYKEAVGFLNKRLAEIAAGNFSGPKIEKVRIDELADTFLRDYRINGRRSLDDVKARWELHLKPFFGDLRAVQVTTDLLSRYVDQRQQQDAANATINRELAALKRMFYLGYRSTPPRVNRVPAFPMLREDNARKGFLEDAQYQKLMAARPQLWFRVLVEVGRTYGWRISELLNLRVRQVDLLAKTLRLEPGTTKNGEGREVTMTKAVYELLALCVSAKSPDAHVFTRTNGNPVRDFREVWKAACTKAGVAGLLFHDLRRTAARNLRRAGVAEGVIMKIGGWRTRSVFERYAIVAQSDIEDAMIKLEKRNGHTFGHSETTADSQTKEAVKPM